MDSQFSNCLRVTLAYEGGWSDHPDDNGGATMRGITIKRYRAYKGRTVTKDELRNISMVEVEDIYRTGYWRPVWGDKLPKGLDLVVFDYAVNSGPSKAVRDLQRVVGVPADGVMGVFTLEAIRKRGVIDLIHALCDRRLAFFRSLGDWRVFGKGWSRRIADIRAKAVGMATSDRAPLPPERVEPTGKAREADVRPITKPGAKEKATATAASVGAAITEATQTLTPHSDSLEVIKWLCIALAVASAGLLLWRAFKSGD